MWHQLLALLANRRRFCASGSSVGVISCLLSSLYASPLHQVLALLFDYPSLLHILFSSLLFVDRWPALVP